MQLRVSRAARRGARRYAPVEGCAVVQVHLCSLRVCWARRVRVRQQTLRGVASRRVRGEARVGAASATRVQTAGCRLQQRGACLDAGQQRGHVVDGAPLVLDDVHAQRAVRVHCTPGRRGSQVSRARAPRSCRRAARAVRMEHLAREAHAGWLLRVVLAEDEAQRENAALGKVASQRRQERYRLARNTAPKQQGHHRSDTRHGAGAAGDARARRVLGTTCLPRRLVRPEDGGAPDKQVVVAVR